MSLGNVFDQNRDLQPPDPRESSSIEIRRWVDQARRHATPKQIADLKANYGYELPALSARQFTPGSDGMANFGTDSNTSPSFNDLYGPEQAQRELDATNAKIAARAAEAARLAAEQAAAERARQAASAEAFRAYHHSLTDPRQKDSWRRNLSSPSDLMLAYAVQRGYVHPTACGFPNQETYDKVRAELNDPRYMSAWGRGL